MNKKSFLLFPLILTGCSPVNPAISSADSLSSQPYSSSAKEEEIPEIADVVILAGQSNCEGHSHVTYLRKNTSESQREDYRNGFENALIRFSSNRGTHKSGGFVPVKEGMGVSTDRFGIEIGIAEALKEAGIQKKTYFIKYAVGGTTLYDDWHSPSSGFGESELYAGMVSFIYDSLSQLEEKNLIPVIRAFCWMQGESDASGNSASAYYGLEKAFVRDVFEEFSYYASEDGILFVDGGISDCPSWTHFSTINDAKKKLSEENPKQHFFIDTIAEGLTYDQEPEGNPDLYHYDALSELRLGKLFGNVLLNENRI